MVVSDKRHLLKIIDGCLIVNHSYHTIGSYQEVYAQLFFNLYGDHTAGEVTIDFSRPTQQFDLYGDHTAGEFYCAV